MTFPFHLLESRSKKYLTVRNTAYPSHDVVVQTVDKVGQPHSEDVHPVDASLSGHVLVQVEGKLCP